MKNQQCNAGSKTIEHFGNDILSQKGINKNFFKIIWRDLNSI